MEASPEELHEFSSMGHLALDAVGFVPIIGEIADIINARIYLKETPPNYLFAAFSIISCVPEIGDIIGKGGKLAVWAARATAKFPAMTRIGARAERILVEVQAMLSKHWKKVDAVLRQIEKQPEEGQPDPLASFRPYIPQIREALRGFYGNKFVSGHDKHVVSKFKQAMA